MVTFVFETKWAQVVLSAMFPPEASLGARSDEMGAGFSTIVRGAPFEAGVGLRLALLMVVLAPIFVLKRPRTFLGLDDETRQRLLEKLQKSGVYAVRQLMMALKTMGALLYAKDRAVRDAMLTPKEQLVTISTKRVKSGAAAEEGERHAVA